MEDLLLKPFARVISFRLDEFVGGLDKSSKYKTVCRYLITVKDSGCSRNPQIRQ